MTDREVAVNLLWCVPGEVGGSEEYLVRQLLGLAETCPDWRPRLYALEGFADAHPDLAAVMPIEVAPFAGTNRARRVIGETGWFHRRAHHAALRHHGGGTAPLGADHPYLLTVHDLQYRTFPEHFSRTKLAFLRTTIPRSVHAASIVAVPTGYVRDTVVAAFGLTPDRVVVVPHGFEPALLAEVTGEAELRGKYALGDGPVLVYPAVTHPHKNHGFLLELMRTSWTDPDLRLVLIGGEGAAEAEITACTDLRVCRLGRVPAADRSGLLAMCAAMVFPSRYEGFGAPLIEAMALGAPILASDATCIPEVVGNAGLVLPLTADGWAGAVSSLSSRREELIAAGRVRALRFTADASGRALGAAYERALELG